MKRPLFRRRAVLAGLALITASLGTIAGAAQQPSARYPTKPIRVVIAQEAGSSIDTNIRVIGPLLGEALGQLLIVDNRPGAGGTLGMTIGAAAAPDGYTLVGVGSPQMIAPFVFKKLRYDVARDFTPIARYVVSQNVFVVAPNFPARNVKEFVDLLRAKRGQLNMSTAGPGSASHLAGVFFNSLTGIEAATVHYKGGGAAVTAILSGESQYLITPMPAVLAQIRAGRLRPLGVGGEHRAPQLPQVPTIAEAGVAGYRSVGWTGLLMPRGVPPQYAALVTAKLRDIIAMPAVREQMLNAGGEPGFLAGAEFGQFIHDELARFGGVAKAAGLKLD
jgi:tripartite-type tricarboxylate transporter receptor subunit TctC